MTKKMNIKKQILKYTNKLCTPPAAQYNPLAGLIQHRHIQLKKPVN